MKEFIMSRPAARIVSPSAIHAQIKTALYAEDGKGPMMERVIKGHFFIGACDWYITEYDKDQDLAFGFCHLGDDQCAEWGYVSVAELRTTTVPLRLAGRIIGKIGPEWDRHWTPKKACEIEKIKRCQ